MAAATSGRQTRASACPLYYIGAQAGARQEAHSVPTYASRLSTPARAAAHRLHGMAVGGGEGGQVEGHALIGCGGRKQSGSSSVQAAGSSLHPSGNC